MPSFFSGRKYWPLNNSKRMNILQSMPCACSSLHLIKSTTIYLVSSEGLFLVLDRFAEPVPECESDKSKNYCLKSAG